jgi:peptidoglycan hydrolase-like protein with peptidoglycan-binding domain
VRARGQQKIDSERAHAIQEALIREHYLSGEPTGKWNDASEAAMRRYQADHGWQSKTVPDSRALIKLGLGPSKDHLLNPESAMTTGPDTPRSAKLTAAPQHAPAATSPIPAPSPAPVPAPAQSDPSSPQ